MYVFNVNFIIISRLWWVMNNYCDHLWVMCVCTDVTDISTLLRLLTYRRGKAASCCRIKEFPESSTLWTNPAEHKSLLGGAFHKIHSQSKLKLFCFQSVQSHPNDSFFNTRDTLVYTVAVRTPIQFKLLSNYQLHRYQEVSFRRKKTMIFKPFPFSLTRLPSEWVLLWE